VGWAVAPPAIASAIRKVHDFLTVGAAAPLQAAAAVALQAPADYYAELAASYARRRERLLGILRGAGFVCHEPRGAYYVMTNVDHFGYADDVAFVRHLVSEIGVAAVPGSSFFSAPEHGRAHVRFCFCKKDETLAAAEARLAALRPAERKRSGAASWRP
jgi:aminotransferase